jgi:hypothetical protein
MIRQFQYVAYSHYWFLFCFCYRELYAVLIVCFYREHSFLVVMKCFEMERFEWI